MRIIVTGATGFIGKEIVSELSHNGYEVYKVGNSEVTEQLIDQKTLKIDITNSEQVKKLEQIEQADVIIHSAGLAHQFSDAKRDQFQKTNVEGTKNILTAAVNLRVKHFILISSTAIYGAEKKLGSEVKIIDETVACHPQTYYAESKLQAEQKAIEICERNKINLTIFRLAPVIGEANSGNVARMIEAIDRKRFLWIGDGENYKSLIYKRDVARACGKIIPCKREKTEIYNLAAANPVLMRELVAEAAINLKRKIPKITISPTLLEGFFRLNEKTIKLGKVEKFAVTVEKWLSDDVYSARKFERDYDFRTETSISDALQKQIVWYLNQKRQRELKYN